MLYTKRPLDAMRHKGYAHHWQFGFLGSPANRPFFQVIANENHSQIGDVIMSLEVKQKELLTNAEYEALLNLYNEYNAAFLTLSDSIISLFYKRLYQGK